MMQQVKSAEDMPGSYGLPFVGDTLRIVKDMELYYWQQFQQYGTVFKGLMFGRKYAYLVSPDANRFILVDQAEHMSSQIGWHFLEPLFGNIILLQDGAKHQVTRRLIYPAFHGRAIAHYFETIRSVVQDLLQDWAERKFVLLASEFRKLALIIGIRLLLGVQIQADIEQIIEWYTELAAGIVTVLRIDSSLTLYGRALNARRKLQAFLRNVIVERKRQGTLEQSRDVLSLLLAAVDEEGNTFTESQAIDEAILLLNGGYQTTTSFLTWLLYEMGSHPEWRERLRQEQTQVVGNQQIGFEHLKQFTQMNYVLKEIERLYPPTPLISRGVLKDIEYAGYRIPKGWLVTVAPMLTHRLPELYANPDHFDPERFAPSREEDKKHPYALVGFGGGAHSCIGFEFAQMQLRIILSLLLQQYDWTVTPERKTIDPVRRPLEVQERLQARVHKLLGK